MSTHTIKKARIHATQAELVPRLFIRAMFGMAALCLLMVAAYRWMDGPVQYAAPQAPIVLERTLYLEGAMSGAARVFDQDRQLMVDLAPEEGGFLSGVWRVLQRERTKARVDLDGPVILRLRNNRRIEIFDPSTGWGADLMGFGATNTAAFARLLN